jgi:hypothetical protein
VACGGVPCQYGARLEPSIVKMGDSGMCIAIDDRQVILKVQASRAMPDPQPDRNKL